MGSGLLSRVRARIRENPVLIAVTIVVVALLLAAPLFFAYVYYPTGCAPVYERPMASYAVNSTPTPDGVRVTVTQSGGDSIPADDLYVEAPGTNTSFASYNTQDVRDSSVDIGDSVVLSGLPNGSRVEVVWRNQSFEYDHECSKGPTPYRYVLAAFVVENESAQLTPSR